MSEAATWAAVPGVIEPGTAGDTDRDHLLYSIAISTKRIADALDASSRLADSAIAVATTNAIAHSINRAIEQGLRVPLNQYGEGIGEAIQGQLERGNRG